MFDALFALPARALFAVFYQNAFVRKFLANGIGFGEFTATLCLCTFREKALDVFVGQGGRSEQAGIFDGTSFGLRPLNGTAPRMPLAWEVLHLAFDDPEIGIRWPLPPDELIVSERDRQAPRLSEIADELPFAYDG